MMFKKILFVIPDMLQGGAEKVVSVMANHWSAKGHLVSILQFNDAPSYFPLDKKINLQSLHSAKRSVWIFGFLVNNYLRTINYFKQVRKIKPDIIISFTDNANIYCLLYNHLLKIPVVITQRTNPHHHTLHGMIDWLPKRMYRRANAMVVQTNQTLSIYRDLSIKLPEKTAVIYNPLPASAFNSSFSGERKKIILAVGRLNNSHKHFDKMIDIFYAIGDQEWQLHIAGDGPDRQMLEDRIRELKMETSIFLLGGIQHLSDLYKSAKIFVLTSKFEGFPNSLCEAMANGCACISYDCSTGPSEMIRSGINGILVESENAEAFARALTDLTKDEELIQRFSTEAVKIKELLFEDKIMNQWEMLIDDVLQSEK